MIVLMYHKRFVAPILSGVKTHTIRRNRKQPIPIGAELSQRVWSDVAYRSPQEEFSRNICTDVLPITVHSEFVLLGKAPPGGFRRLIAVPEFRNAFAVSDGFENWADLMTYYRCNKIATPFDGDYIEWAFKGKESAQ